MNEMYEDIYLVLIHPPVVKLVKGEWVPLDERPVFYLQYVNECFDFLYKYKVTV